MLDSVRRANDPLMLKPDHDKKLNGGGDLGGGAVTRVRPHDRPVCCSTNEKKIQRGDRETEQKGSKMQTGDFAYMVTDYGGTKGPQGLGAAILRRRVARSLSLAPSSFSFAYPAASS